MPQDSREPPCPRPLVPNGSSASSRDSRRERGRASSTIRARKRKGRRSGRSRRLEWRKYIARGVSPRAGDMIPWADLLEEGLYDPPLPGESASRLRSSTSWLYASGRLLRADAFDASGAKMGSLAYSYDASGRLIEVQASGSFGSTASGILLSGAGARRLLDRPRANPVTTAPGGLRKAWAMPRASLSVAPVSPTTAEASSSPGPPRISLREL